MLWRHAYRFLFLLPALSLAGHDHPARQFSANVVIRTGAERSGVEARMHFREGNLRIDFPDSAHHRTFPFWYTSSGVLATVKDVPDDDMGMALRPAFVMLVLAFREEHLDSFCRDFRDYLLKVLPLQSKMSDEEIAALQQPNSLPCKLLSDREDTVAGHKCKRYEVLVPDDEDYQVHLCFDDRLNTVLRVRVNEPPFAQIELSEIKEGPQPSALFELPPDAVVMLQIK